jgi:hypothetical protein
MEGFSTPRFAKRTASAACQATPHRPEEPLLHRPWDLQSLGPLLSPARAALPQTPTPQTTWSLPDWAPKACQASDPQAFMISTRPCPSGLHRPAQSLLGHAPRLAKPAFTDIHDLCKAVPPRPAQASTISSGSRPSGLPSQWSTDTYDLHSAGPAPFMHSRPMLQRLVRSPQWQASTHRPMGHHPSATCHLPQEGSKPA